MWMAVVAVVYVGATMAVAHRSAPEVDRMIQLAVNLLHGHTDLGPVSRPNDIVTIGGRNYQALSLLPTVPYLLFVPFPALWASARWIIPAALGTISGWLALPLARRYGPAGPATYWLAALAAFGTLVFTQSIEGNFYYLAQVEAFVWTLVMLLEWSGRRRGWLVGLALAMAGLARPTVLLAAIPFGAALLMEGRERARTLTGFTVPLVLSIAVAGLWDLVRFGSPLETGYTLSSVSGFLATRRAEGLFSLRHLPYNLGLFIGGGFDLRLRFPGAIPDPTGQSMLLTTPALLIAVGAGISARLNQLLWIAAILVAIPVFLYYGGGGADTYGYRYALDFIPFLLVLVAIAAKRHFGALEQLLILLSIGFVGYGAAWAILG